MAHDFSEILDKISRNTTTQNSTTSSYTTAAKTVDVNDALSNYFILANEAVGNARPADDTNQTDYPVTYFSLVSGQQDYSFTVDANGNQILNIYKVRILGPNGIDWITLDQIDQDTITDADLSVVNSGIPSQYYLTANGIFLVQKPNYSSTNGGEIHNSRTPSYFVVSDTTKKPGIPWVHIEYLSLRPSYFYCMQKGLPQAGGRLKNGSYTGYLGNLIDMETAIKKYWRDRNHDFSQSISGEKVNSI
jgi:hypothetical protein